MFDWKQQFSGWKRKISFAGVALVLLVVVAFFLAYLLSNISTTKPHKEPQWQQALSLLIAVALGYVLVQASYGFGAHFRVLYKQQYELVDGSELNEAERKTALTKNNAIPQYKTLQAHALMLSVSTFLFSVLYITDKAAGWGHYSPEASPMTISILLGGFLFGLGMQLGDACASGTLFLIGSGSLWAVFLLIFFVCGSTIATALQSAGGGVWNIGFPKHTGLSLLFPGTFLKKSYGITFFETHAWLQYVVAVVAVIIQMGILIGIVIGVHYYNKKKLKSSGSEEETTGLINGDEVKAPSKSNMVSNFLFRVMFGPWDLMTGGVALAILNFLFLLVTAHPMGLTGPFALIGSQILNAIAPGLEVNKWSAWKGTDLPKANVIGNLNFILDYGIVLGALIAALMKGKFPSFLDGVSFKKDNTEPFSVKNLLAKIFAPIYNNVGIIVAKIIGGILMGIGAKFGYGCNIGGYFSGVSCFSIHGYVWIIMALMGGYIGAVVRPMFGYKKRKVACHVC